MFTTTEPPDGRGCGERDGGVPYACCGFSEDGTPIEFYVVDPAIPWPGEFQRGVKILPRNPQDVDSINDLVIFISKNDYPSPWDFVEETRRFGASRKLSHNLPFDKLMPGKSRMVFIHSRAIPSYQAKYPVSNYMTTKEDWGVGIFMALPLTHIEYCRQIDEGSQAKAEAAGFKTVVMEY